MTKRSHWPISVLASVSAIFNAMLPLVLVRILEPADVGLFKIFFLYVVMIPSFSLTSGLTSGLAYWAGRGEQGRSAIRTSGTLTLAASAVFFLLALVLREPVAAHFEWPAIYSVVFAFSVFGGVSTFFFEEAAIATGRIWTGAIFHSGFEATRTLLILITAALTHDLLSILTVHAGMIVLKALAGYAYASRLGLFGLEFDREAFRGVWKYSFPVSLAWMFGVFINYGDQFILSNFIDPAQFALYTIGCLSIPPILIIEQSVTRVMIPQLSEAFAGNRISRAAGLYRSAVDQMAFLFIPAVTGLIVFADPIIRLLFTDQYASAAGVLRVFAGSYLLLMIPYDAVARARGQGGWILRNFIIFSVISLPLLYLLTRAFGAFGALGGILFVRTLMKAYSIWYSRHSAGWKLSEFLPFGQIVRYCAVSVGLGVLAWSMRTFFESELIWFIAAGAGFSVLYFAILLPWSNITGLSDRVAGADSGKGHVLMLTQHLGIGGLEKMILNLSLRLKETGGWDVSVFTYDQVDLEDDPRYANLIGDFRKAGIFVRAFRKGAGFSIKAVVRLVRDIYRNKVHVIHSHDLGSLIYAVLGKVCSLWRVRLVHTQHSFVHINRRRRYRVYERLFTAFVDELTVVNDSAVEPYVDLGVPARKIHVVRNGVAFPERPVGDRSEQRMLREELIGRLSQGERLRDELDSRWVIYLARIHHVKGQVHAVKVWSELDREVRRNTLLLILGPEADPDFGAKLREAIAAAPDSDRILLMGATREPQSWIRTADCYLSCSEFEGMPLGPLEAMGAGLPAVVSRIPGHEFLGEAAPAFDLADPARGASLLTASLGKAGEEGYKEAWARSAWIRDSFSLDAMAERYASLYLGPPASPDQAASDRAVTSTGVEAVNYG